MRTAITGGVAEGKSTVLGYLAQMGYKTYSVDEAAKAVFDSEDVQRQLSALLGYDAPISRDLLRTAIGIRKDLRREVNRIMHPAIARDLLSSEAEFFEVPLLIETCLQDQFDRVWVVTCGSDEQMRRLTNRIGRSDAVRIMSIQLSTHAKIPFADHVVRTNQPEANVLLEVRTLVNKALLM